MMPNWPENLEFDTLQELLQLQLDNKAWGKELRRQSSELVESRLAKVITQDDYLSARKVSVDASSEYRRRSVLLGREIDRHSRDRRPRPPVLHA